jgi:cation diffusion facilitator family transporter
MSLQCSRGTAVRRVLIIVLVLNLLVAAAKAVYGLVSGSLAIASDALHSVADAGSNIIGLVVIHFASAPPDHGHPYGHHKLEIVAATGIGVAIGMVALRFTWSALSALIHGAPPPQTSTAGFVVLVATLVINVFVALYEARRARALSSSFLAADAAHTASDVLVTTAVLGSFLASHLGVRWADPIGALVVIAVIARVAWKIIARNVAILVDRAAVDTAAVEAVVGEVPGVHGCHRVRSRGTDEAVQLDLHLLVQGDVPLRRAHTIAHQVEDALRARFPTLMDVTIHVEPEEDGEEGL